MARLHRTSRPAVIGLPPRAREGNAVPEGYGEGEAPMTNRLAVVRGEVENLARSIKEPSMLLGHLAQRFDAAFQLAAKPRHAVYRTSRH